MKTLKWLSRVRLSPWAWGAIGAGTVLVASPLLRRSLRKGVVGLTTGAMTASIALAEAGNKIKGAWESLVEEIRSRRSDQDSADEVKEDVLPEEG